MKESRGGCPNREARFNILRYAKARDSNYLNLAERFNQSYYLASSL